MPLHSLHSSPETLAATPAIAIGFGAALLVAGRKLFWLFVAAVGFYAAVELATPYFGAEHRGGVLIASLVAGVIGAIFAVFVQKFAVGLAGAVTGAYLLDQFFRGLATYPELGWIFLIAAAIVGALMMAIVFDWALIFLTSLAGAHLIAQLLPLQRGWMTAAYVVLFAIGVGIQSRRFRRA